MYILKFNLIIRAISVDIDQYSPWYRHIQFTGYVQYWLILRHWPAILSKFDIDIALSWYGATLLHRIGWKETTPIKFQFEFRWRYFWSWFTGGTDRRWSGIAETSPIQCSQGDSMWWVQGWEFYRESIQVWVSYLLINDNHVIYCMSSISCTLLNVLTLNVRDWGARFCAGTYCNNLFLFCCL